MSKNDDVVLGRVLMWSAIILLVPTAGILFFSQLNSIWQLMVLASGAVLFSQLGFRGEGFAGGGTNRIFFLLVSTEFAIMALAWLLRLVHRIYVSGSLGV